MYTQRCEELDGDIQTDGCALVAAAHLVTCYRPRDYIGPEELNHVYKAAIESGIMEPKAYMVEWGGVFELLGLKVDYLGHKGRNYECADDEIELVKWTLSVPHEGINWTHFVVGDGQGRTTFDPWGATQGYRTSRTVAEGVRDSKRVFRLRS